jgi:hypothetical protein
MPSHVGAFFITENPDGALLRSLAGGDVTPITAMYVTMSTAITVAAALEGRSQQLPAVVRRDVLSEFKTQLKFVVHEATHAIGPPDIEEFEREVEQTARSGLTPWKEAITELATQRNLNAIIQAAKLDRSDPMLLDVADRDTGSYVGMVEAADVIVQGLSAMIPGADAATELRAIVAKGSGRRALDDLVGRAMSARGRVQPGLVASVRNAIGGCESALDEEYSETLAKLDIASPERVEPILNRLREHGAASGKRVLGDIERRLAAKGPAVLRAATGAGSQHRLAKLVTRNLVEHRAPLQYGRPGPGILTRRSSGATLDGHE